LGEAIFHARIRRVHAYIIRRLLLAVVTVFIVSFMAFLLMRLIPGTIVDAIVAQMMATGDAGSLDIMAVKEQVEARLGLDRPLLVQYGLWLSNIILYGDLGKSFFTDSPVIQEIGARWPVTLELSFMGILISQLIALPIGVYSALRQNSWADYVGRSLAILFIAVPAFWIGTMVIVFPSIWWGYMPPIMHTRFIEEPIENLRMFVIPGIVLGMTMAGETMRMTRTMMLEVLRQDYLRTAWAKGLGETVIIIRHALKNALIPIITVIGLRIPILIGGTVIIENIFMLPGMGRLLLNAINTRDYTVVSGVVLFYGIALVLVNLLVDLTYARLDPRIQYR
jgi:peptide/nickel transport system permease protein